MNAVFVTDESLVYQIHSSINRYTFWGEPHRDAPWGVRGTLFFMFESTPSAGTTRFWAPLNYQVGQWYWEDVEIRFGMNMHAPGNRIEATVQPGTVFWLYSDGRVRDSYYWLYYVKPLSNLPVMS